ncbi:MAG: acyl-CoA dehydrogenase C-terminal domain-containing protein, partial [Desulfococcaceae bacterium]
GKRVMDLLGEMNRTIADAKARPELENLAGAFEQAVNKLGEVGIHMGTIAMSPKVLTAFAFAHPFMEVTGDVAMAWMLLWRAAIAAGKLEKAKSKDKAFYEGQIKSAEYFVTAILPITRGKMNAILASNDAAVAISEDAFGGK